VDRSPSELLGQIAPIEAGVDQAIASATEVLESALKRGVDVELVASILDLRANAHLAARTGRRERHVAAALDDCRRALELTPVGHKARVGRMLRVAAVIGEQVDGDPRGRAQASERVLREAIGLLDETSDPETLALARTNLALALQIQAREGDATLLREARELCEAALLYRSPQRNPTDWAYSMINLGVILGQLAALGETDPGDGLKAYEAVITQAAVLPPDVVAHARMNLLAVTFDEIARVDRELDADPEQRARLTAAASLARDVASASDASPAVRGRALRRLGLLSERLGNVTEARAAFERALPLLDESDLKELQLAAWNLASIEVSRGEWAMAATAYRRALHATEILIDAPSDHRDRTEQTGAASRLPRWAARAFAQIGNVDEAVVTIENGRARELRRQLQSEDPDLHALEGLLPDTVAKWRIATARLAAPDGDGALTVQAAREALAEMRAVPGYERFGAGTSLDGIRAAARPGAPVVYVNPTPTGTLVLQVGVSGEVAHRLLPVTSQDVVLRVQLGFDPRFEPPPERFVSYIAAAAGNPTDMEPGRELPDIGPALDRLLPWVGEHIASAIDDMLLAADAREALLVVSGPLATVPLAAAPFGTKSACLLDSFVISTTPSATSHVAARRRAAASGELFSCLVSVADPTDDLEFTRTEVREVARHFPAVLNVEGHLATCEWIRENAKHGSVLHFAGHAFGGLLDATRSGFVLADGHLAGPEVARLGPLRARLAVASACQSGVIGIGDLADEAFSLGSALLAAGAACSIASLWPVDDLATAILMARLYEELTRGLEPPTALAAAQRWLRDLTESDRCSFLLRHAVIAEHERARRSGTDEADGRVGRVRQPYHHARYWAAFVALGA